MSETLHEAFKFFAAAGMAQFAQRLGLNLPDALARHREILADLFERMIRVLPNPEPLAQDPLFAGGQGFERVVDLSLKVIPNRRLERRDRLLVLYKIAEVAVFFL